MHKWKHYFAARSAQPGPRSTVLARGPHESRSTSTLESVRQNDNGVLSATSTGQRALTRSWKSRSENGTHRSALWRYPPTASQASLRKVEPEWVMFLSLIHI